MFRSYSASLRNRLSAYSDEIWPDQLDKLMTYLMKRGKQASKLEKKILVNLGHIDPLVKKRIIKLYFERMNIFYLLRMIQYLQTTTKDMPESKVSPHTNHTHLPLS